ncbi:hypothetical protein Ddye_013879 [Dipteronia dyeriana]|uniref:Jacalin-type lectin domain-containing protein n=1 Tax=Dipteronia dyeriana TaxID=168575 RepID=A0AAD9X7T4_9ROSI|nr:hypothetical protein Ddye_013879 [Dipteronia dyeriana]
MKSNVVRKQLGVGGGWSHFNGRFLEVGGKVKLDCSSEYLVGMVGFYGRIEENGGFEAVRSISFYTNNEKYGPFGTEIGTGFGSPTFNGKIVGFHGRSGAYLDAIGVHMEYF